MTLVREPKKYDPTRGPLGAFLYAAHTLHDHRKQEISCVAVKPVTPHARIQGLLPHHDLQRIVVGRYTVEIDCLKPHQIQVVPQAARVVQKM